MFLIGLHAQDDVMTTQSNESSVSQSKVDGLVSKKGIYILPERGEFCLGIDADPFLHYLGGIFSNNHATTPDIDAISDTYKIGISGKYMASSNTAYRISFYVDASSENDFLPVRKSLLTPNELDPQYVDDEQTTSATSFQVAAGLEKRRGNSRIQGIYGAELLVEFFSEKIEYNYGNPITNQFTTPDIAYNAYGTNGERLIKTTVDNSFGVGVKAFVGVEYFIAPKLSLGGEVGYVVEYAKEGDRTNVYEYWNSAQQTVSNMVHHQNSEKDNFMGITTDVIGNLSLFFYF
jgi:hypothetical protein